LVAGLLVGMQSVSLSDDGAGRIDTLSALIARVRAEEARYANHSASFRTTSNFIPPDEKEIRGGRFGGAGQLLRRTVVDAVTQEVSGTRFRYRGEEIFEYIPGG